MHKTLKMKKIKPCPNCWGYQEYDHSNSTTKDLKNNNYDRIFK